MILSTRALAGFQESTPGSELIPRPITCIPRPITGSYRQKQYVWYAPALSQSWRPEKRASPLPPPLPAHRSRRRALDFIPASSAHLKRNWATGEGAANTVARITQILSRDERGHEYSAWQQLTVRHGAGDPVAAARRAHLDALSRRPQHQREQIRPVQRTKVKHYPHLHQTGALCTFSRTNPRGGRSRRGARRDYTRAWVRGNEPPPRRKGTPPHHIWGAE